ncbi:MAG: hypothetical protein E7263_05470 [Lachnospiraceae bacterium]|nr:hypothetical protein [Lachnospiraceae bacterium]
MSKKKVIVLGGNGIGMIASSVIDRIGDAEVVGFLNDVIEVGTEVGTKKKIKVIGTSDDIPKYLADPDYYFVLAFGGMQREKEVYEKISKLGIPEDRYYTAIDPTAVVPWDYSEIGYGTIMAPLSQVSPDSVISHNCILLGNSFVGHDTFVDEFTHIATNATVGSWVHVGKSVHIGSNATIKEKVVIGDYSLVGAGAVVVKDVPENSIVVGNPAKVLRMKG